MGHDIDNSQRATRAQLPRQLPSPPSTWSSWIPRNRRCSPTSTARCSAGGSPTGRRLDHHPRGSGAGMAFQLAPDLVPPTWPDNTVPQQSHLDVTVPDLDIAERQVLAIGARATGEPQQAEQFPGVPGSVRSPVLPVPAPTELTSRAAGRPAPAGQLAGWPRALRPAHPGPTRGGPGRLDRRPGRRARVVGFDGPTEIGTAALADAVAQRLRALGRPVSGRRPTGGGDPPRCDWSSAGRTSTCCSAVGWTPRPCAANCFDPLLPGGSGRYLPRLRDPETDRSLRDERVAVGRTGRGAARRSVPAGDRPALDAVVHLQVSTGHPCPIASRPIANGGSRRSRATGTRIGRRTVPRR